MYLFLFAFALLLLWLIMFNGRRSAPLQRSRQSAKRIAPDVNSDPLWKENFVFGDVPVGRYQVVTNIDGQRVVQRVDVSEGMTSFVDLALQDSPATVTPTVSP